MMKQSKSLEETTGSFSHQLEERARSLARKITWDPSVSSSIEREVALTLEHLDTTREFREEQLRRLLKAECYVESDLLKLDSYRPRQYHFMFDSRDRLKNKLLQIDKERRQLLSTHLQETRELQGKLFNLLNQHAQTSS